MLSLLMPPLIDASADPRLRTSIAASSIGRGTLTEMALSTSGGCGMQGEVAMASGDGGGGRGVHQSGGVVQTDAAGEVATPSLQEGGVVVAGGEALQEDPPPDPAIHHQGTTTYLPHTVHSDVYSDHLQIRLVPQAMYSEEVGHTYVILHH